MRILEGILVNIFSSILLWLGGLLLGNKLDPIDIKPREIPVGPIIVIISPSRPDHSDPPPAKDPPVSDNLACTDIHGLKGAFRAMVFLDSYNWVRGSTELVEFNGEVIPYFPTVLRQEPVQKVLSQAAEIVAVGTASCESPLGFLFENRRAEQRAEQLVRWIEESRDSLPSRPDAPMRNVIPLSLGRYTKECPTSEASATSRQRRIVLLAVTEITKALDLESCLQRAMQEDRSLKFLTDNYSKFDLDAGFKNVSIP